VTAYTHEVAVLGAGPVGLLAALALSRSGRKVIVVADHFPHPDDARRADAVPAAFVALLVELGIAPSSVGADRLHDLGRSAWDSEAPQLSPTPKIAHLERPALDLALLGVLRRNHGAPVTFEQQKLNRREPLDAARWNARRVVDATGRTAATAAQRLRPPKPWVARTFCAGHTGASQASEFSIASLPDGYAYRLGSANMRTLGVVGRADSVGGSPDEIEERLREFAPWLLAGMPALASMHPNKARPASVQWSVGPSGLQIGDAALARDALSSQGMATGSSESLLAAACQGERDLALIRNRQFDQRQAHLRSLLGMIERCRYRDHRVWRDYRTFVAAHIDPAPIGTSAALRGRRIEPVDVSH
jgi:2-polyprenyl-6-methoxyphenol hydroxylase-like FAD-dependent oxidoreductase